MRINKKRMMDAKSFRLRYLEKRGPKRDSNDFSEMLKDKINKLKIATNRDFDYTTKQNISKILRKLDGELSTSEKRDVVEMTENMLNKLPKYNNQVSDIIDEIHDLLDDCKLSMNDTKDNAPTIPDSTSVLPRYVFTKNNTKEVKNELWHLNSELKDMAWDAYDAGDYKESARLEDLANFTTNTYITKEGAYIANKNYGYFNELNSKNKDYILGRLKEIADKYELKETKRRSNAEDSNKMRDDREEYCVMKGGNNIECFGARNEAISFAKKNKANKVLRVKYGNRNEEGDEDELESEPVWERDSLNKKHKKDAFISHDVDARVSDWRDVLRIYLEWEGILGYNFIIEEYLEEKDFDGLREYLEDEGIYGYFDDIVDIYETGEVNIPDMDEEDYEKFF